MSRASTCAKVQYDTRLPLACHARPGQVILMRAVAIPCPCFCGVLQHDTRLPQPVQTHVPSTSGRAGRHSWPPHVRMLDSMFWLIPLSAGGWAHASAHLHCPWLLQRRCCSPAQAGTAQGRAAQEGTSRKQRAARLCDTLQGPVNIRLERQGHQPSLAEQAHPREISMQMPGDWLMDGQCVVASAEA